MPADKPAHAHPPWNLLQLQRHCRCIAIPASVATTVAAALAAAPPAPAATAVAATCPPPLALSPAPLAITCPASQRLHIC